MYRHSPVRNPRSKGIKIKQVLQVCLLVAVCFWLIFQVKRSHDKKKEFDASDTKISSSMRTHSDEAVKFGRKDLQPKLDETTKEVEIHEEGEELEQEEQDENKHEEEELEENKHEEEEHEESKHEEEEQEENEENKHEDGDQDEEKMEEEKDDGGGGADDETDENEQEKSDVEIEREEMDTIDEDKDTEESGEKDGESKSDNSVSSDEDGATVHTHEAREEHYKADDASSAVTHDENENRNGTLDNSSENIDNDETAANTTVIQETGSVSAVTPLNATTLIDAHENGPPSNATVITSDSTQTPKVTQGVTVSGEQAGNSTTAASVPNATLTEVTEGSANSTYVSEDMKSNAENSSKTEVETDAGEGESLNTEDTSTNEGTEETLDSYETNTQEHDPIDSTDPSHLEEKEVRTDLETLPEIETEGGNSEDTAAE